MPRRSHGRPPAWGTMAPGDAAPGPTPSSHGAPEWKPSSSTRPTPEAEAHSEGLVARAIEGQTAKLPSDVFLWAALASMGVSLGMKLAGKREGSLFVGQWAAPLLVLGVYNKLVKIGGSDRVHDR